MEPALTVPIGGAVMAAGSMGLLRSAARDAESRPAEVRPVEDELVMAAAEAEDRVAAHRVRV
jgi:hypothetical protein